MSKFKAKLENFWEERGSSIIRSIVVTLFVFGLITVVFILVRLETRNSTNVKSEISTKPSIDTTIKETVVKIKIVNVNQEKILTFISNNKSDLYEINYNNISIRSIIGIEIISSDTKYNTKIIRIYTDMYSYDINISDDDYIKLNILLQEELQ